MGEELEAREAVRQAYQAHYRRLVAALYALTGDYADAQDLVQEAYARALARPRQFLDVADPEAWLRTVAVNLARTRWRRRRLFDTLVRSGRVARPVDSVPGADPNRVALVAALQQLSRATRETIVLHHLADMSVHEVAEALGVPVGTVKARLSRGRGMLANLLSEHADDPVRRPPAPPVAGPGAAPGAGSRPGAAAGPGPASRPGPVPGPASRPGPVPGPASRPGPVPGPARRPGQVPVPGPEGGTAVPARPVPAAPTGSTAPGQEPAAGSGHG